MWRIVDLRARHFFGRQAHALELVRSVWRAWARPRRRGIFFVMRRNKMHQDQRWLMVLMRTWYDMARNLVIHHTAIKKKDARLMKMYVGQADTQIEKLLHIIYQRWHKEAAIESVIKKNDLLQRSISVTEALKSYLAPKSDTEILFRGFIDWRTVYMQDKFAKRTSVRKIAHLFCMSWSFQMVASLRMTTFLMMVFSTWHARSSNRQRGLAKLRRLRSEAMASGDEVWPTAFNHSRKDEDLSEKHTAFAAWSLYCRRAVKTRYEVAIRQNQELSYMQAKGLQAKEESRARAISSASAAADGRGPFSPRARIRAFPDGSMSSPQDMKSFIEISPTPRSMLNWKSLR